MSEVGRWIYEGTFTVRFRAGAQDEALHRLREYARELEARPEVEQVSSAWPTHRHDLDGAFAKKPDRASNPTQGDR